MMLLDKLRAVQESALRPDEFSGPFVKLIHNNTGTIHHENISFANRYTAEAVVGVAFYANEVMYPDALRNAHRQLARALYGEVLYELAAIRAAIYAGDRAEALRTLDALDKAIGESL